MLYVNMASMFNQIYSTVHPVEFNSTIKFYYFYFSKYIWILKLLAPVTSYKTYWGGGRSLVKEKQYTAKIQ